MLITANQPFGEWNKIFPDPIMTLAAVDRLVHHATILEMNVESYRRRAAIGAQARFSEDPRSARQPTNRLIDAPRHRPTKPLAPWRQYAAMITTAATRSVSS